MDSATRRLFTHLFIIAFSAQAFSEEAKNHSVRELPAEERRVPVETFTLVFEDEFEGDALNREVWAMPHEIRQGTSRWDSKYARVGGGRLWLDVKKTDDATIRYESVGLNTAPNNAFFHDNSKASFAHTFGYWEIRCRLPKHLGADYWAAFWLLTGNVLQGGASDSRKGVEIDIMESFSLHNRGYAFHNLHWGGYGVAHNAGGPVSGFHPQLTDDELHTFGLFWDRDLYAFCVDGEIVAVTDGVGLGEQPDGKKVQSQGTSLAPAIMTISVEAAPWAGAHWDWEKEMPDADTFEVDYVRVYDGTLDPAVKTKLMDVIAREKAAKKE